MNQSQSQDGGWEFSESISQVTLTPTPLKKNLTK